MHYGGSSVTIDTGAGNDTLTGGKGNDLFVYDAGNDVITDYAAGDRISIGTDVTASSLNGSDAVLTVGKNTLTVKNVGHNELTLIDAEGSELTTIIGSVIYDDEDASKVTLASGVDIGDATSRTADIRLVGNALDNSIVGGLGNDTLYGSYGKDVFIYANGDGKDVISGFANDDMLQITGTFSATYNATTKAVAFKVGSTTNAITLKNFTASTFNVNGDDYIVSGKTLTKK